MRCVLGSGQTLAKITSERFTEVLLNFVMQTHFASGQAGASRVADAHSQASRKSLACAQTSSRHNIDFHTLIYMWET